MREPISYKELSEDEAVAFYNSGVWKTWSDEQIVEFQLFQPCLAVPFGRFHEAIEKVLGRSVWIHEFGFSEQLKDEYLGKTPAPDMQGIFDKLVDLVGDKPITVTNIGNN
jgi:hypothetical protein